MEVHDGPGVLPGRYAGPAIPLHRGPTPQQIALAENALSMLLGRPPGPVGRAPLVATEQLPPSIPPGLPASLLERRPDVVAAEQLLVSANADIGAAKALFFPQINLTGFIGGISGDLTSFLGAEGAVWSAGAGVLQPIFQGGRLRRNLEATQARFDAAVAEYRKAALNGYREVADSLVAIQKLALVRVGIIQRQTLKELRRYIYFGIAVLSAAITPGDTITATVLLTGPLILLYELGIWLSREPKVKANP